MYKVAISRPITTLMFVVALVIFGYQGFKNMPASLFPKVDFPIVTITTTYPGADSKSVESKVSDKIEEVVSAIDGVDAVSSTSSDGISSVIVQFVMEKDLNEAANDVRDKVNSIRFDREVDKPLVRKFDMTGGAIINVFVASDKASDEEMMVFVDTKIKPILQRVNGVGQVNAIGYKEREIKIFPDPFLLNKYGISISELNQIISIENVKKGGGRLITKQSELSIKTEADAKSIDELKNIKIKDGLRLQDIAKVEDGLEDARSYASYNGAKGVLLEIKKISGENSVAIARDVKKIVPQLKEIGGERYDINYVGDTSLFILRSLHETEFDLLYGAILSVIIVFFFLRNFTATIVAALAIPTSIFGTFFLMSYMGFELNVMTLIGLALAIGIMIDDAIVVIENIYKKIEAGYNAYDAALVGVKEIIFSIVGISAMLLAVFIPVTFMDGIVGSFFESFAMTISFAIIISFIIVTTLVPSISARILKKGESKFYHATEPFFAWLDNTYGAFLKVAVRFKYLTLGLILVIFIVSLSLGKYIGMDFKPKEDNSELRVKIEAPSGISLEEMIKLSSKIAKEVEENEYVQYTTLRIGYNSIKEINKANIYAKLIDVSERTKGQFEIIEEFREIYKDRTDLNIAVEEQPTLEMGDVAAPFQFLLKSDSLEKLEQTSNEFVKRLKNTEGFADVDSTLSEGKPELKININREVAAKYGISANEISVILNTAFSSDSAVSQFAQDGKQYNITLRFDDNLRKTQEDIKRMQIKTPKGEIIYLDGLITFEESLTNSAIQRRDRQRMVNVYAQPQGIDLGEAVKRATAIIDEIKPDGMTYELYGQAKEMKKTGDAFAMAVSMTLILMFIILAALYESLIQPIIIMITLPLSVTGVMLALFLSGYSFNLFVMIGIMLLLGMVGKNGVLIVDFANQEIEKGKEITEAIIDAGKKRLRPVLMTTFAMIFAMLPIALATGSGSETKAPMATAIIGGLISSTILTLLVIPAFYRILYPLDRWLRKFYEYQEPELKKVD